MTNPLALIDGDIFVVQSASRGENHYPFADEVEAVSLDFEYAIHNLKVRIQTCLDAIGTDRVLIALSDPDSRYFRHDLDPEYKGNRRSTPPPALRKDVRAWLEENYKTTFRTNLEADDVLGIIHTSHENTVCVSTDKDMRQVPGLHLNSDSVDEGIYEITKEEGDRWHLMQTLMGDATDNYPGRKGTGPKKAPGIVDGGWPAVVEDFAAIGKDEDFALLQARLAKILQAEDWDSNKQEPILWQPN